MIFVTVGTHEQPFNRLICLCQKFFMKDREKRTQSIRRIMLRQQNL